MFPPAAAKKWAASQDSGESAPKAEKPKGSAKFPPGTRVKSSKTFNVSLGGKGLKGVVVDQKTDLPADRFVVVKWDGHPEATPVAIAGLARA